MFVRNLFGFNSIDLNDRNRNINGYSILRDDHLSNSNRGVCIYFKQSLLLIRIYDLSTMQETIVSEI